VVSYSHFPKNSSSFVKLAGKMHRDGTKERTRIQSIPRAVNEMIRSVVEMQHVNL